MNFYSTLLNQINKKKARIGIIGLGYVGLPLAIEFAKKKFNVTGFDIDVKKIESLKKNKSYINHISSVSIKQNQKNINFTFNFKNIKKNNIIILCLPTPLTINLNPDLSYIKKTLENIKKYLSEGQLIILESSTYPGSTRNIILPYLKKFKVGENFFLAYSPEREDPNNKKYKLKDIPKICSGYSKKCFNLTKSLYKQIIKKIVNVSSLETAEFVKLYENIYRSINIGLVNEMKMISYKLNLNIYEIINAAKTKPFGFQPFFPGPGVGGHCIPIDPYYLSWIANKENINTKLIYQAGKINSFMPSWIISETLKVKKIKKTLLIGVAYKKNIDDTRESPALDFINIFNKKKIKVDFYDPNIKYLKSRKLNKTYHSISLNHYNLQKYDTVFIITDHSNINYKLIKKSARFIIDTRNIYKDKSSKILKL